MSRKRRNISTTIEFCLLRQGMMKEISENGPEEVSINWSRFIDRSISINPYGDVVLDKQLRRGNIILRIGRNGKMEWYYVPPFRGANRKMAKGIKIDSTIFQEEALRIILCEVYDKERDLIHKTEFPNTKSVSAAFTAALFPNQGDDR